MPNVIGRKFRSGTIAMIPLVGFLVIAFNAPILSMLARSVGGASGFGAYAELIDVSAFRSVLIRTFTISAAVTGFCLVLAYPLACWIATLAPRGRIVALTLVVLPFWVSVLVRTYAFIVVLGQSGLLNRFLMNTGLFNQPVQFLYNSVGVTIGMVNVLIPVMVLTLFSAIVKIDRRLLDAARVLGASEQAVFWRVFLPLTVPAIITGATLTFVIALGFYITPAILGGGRIPLVANVLDFLINEMPRWDLAAALSTIVLAVSVAAFALSRAFERKYS